MRVVFMGTPGFAVPVLEHLVLDGYTVVAVYTQPDRPAGRGRATVLPPVKQAAQVLGLPVVQPESLNRPDAVAELERFRPDVIAVTAYGQILPQAVLDVPRFKCLNVHFSLLPKYRGASPVAAAILGGEEFTGVTVMVVERRLDTGPVLARLVIPISDLDNTFSLTSKLAKVGARFLPDVMDRWVRNEIKPQIQNEAEASYFGSIAKEAGQIDWHLSAVEIWRKVRAYYPWPGSYTMWRGRQLNIIEAVPLPAIGALAPGRVITLESARPGVAFGIATGKGILGVLRVRLEGKQAMPADQFLRGQHEFIGSVLPSG